MRSILVLSSTYPRWPGDTEPAFVHFLNKQLAGRFRVVVLAPHYPGASRYEEMDGIEVHRFRYFLPFGERLAYDGGIIQNLKKSRLKLLLVPLFLASQFINIAILCRRYRISVIHAHWIIPQGLLAVLARASRLIPANTGIVCTSHGGDLFSLQGRLMRRLKHYVFRKADHSTVVSSAMREYLLETGCSAENITVRSMGVDLRNQFVPDENAGREYDLVFVGRLVEKKGVSTLIDALPALLKNHPGLILAIVGDGPERSSLEQQVRALQLVRHVQFMGAVPNDRVPGYYRAARIAVVPSIVAADGDQEGLGLVAVEALGCGCPVIVADLPALKDVVTDGENGLVFRSGDASDLARQLARLLDDRELLERIARAARPSVTGKFDWETVGGVYRQVIAKCAPGAIR